jgi:hypothetical protein
MSTDKPVGATLTTEHEAGQIGRANASGRTPAAFVHGLCLLSSSWDRCADLFETAGWVGTDTGGPTTRRRPRRPVDRPGRRPFRRDRRLPG